MCGLMRPNFLFLSCLQIHIVLLLHPQTYLPLCGCQICYFSILLITLLFLVLTLHPLHIYPVLHSHIFLLNLSLPLPISNILNLAFLLPYQIAPNLFLQLYHNLLFLIFLLMLCLTPHILLIPYLFPFLQLTTILCKLGPRVVLPNLSLSFVIKLS